MDAACFLVFLIFNGLRAIECDDNEHIDPTACYESTMDPTIDSTKDPSFDCDAIAESCLCDVQKWMHPYQRNHGYYFFCNPHITQS